jgi:hypothetical protein
MRVWVVALSVGGACVGDDPDKGPIAPDGTADADADADADSDADADADTDADTDTDTDTDTITDTAAANCPVPWVPPGPSNADCTVRWTVDYDDDLSLDSAFVEVYSATGKIERRVEDWGADGTEDAILVTLYDPVTDLPVRTEHDWNADGTVDSWEEHTYDAAGWLTEIVSYEAQGGTTRLSATNGPCGPTLVEYDYADDGVIDTLLQYAYGPTTRLTEIDSPVDGVIENTWTETFDATVGHLLRREEEYDASHAGPDTLWDVSYDAAGHRTRERRQFWNGSVFVAVDVTYALDADGREAEVFETGPYARLRTRADWVCP